MPAQGSLGSSKSNIVNSLPGLPVQMQYGTVSWSVSFEGQPSGSLEYLGCTEQKLSQVKSAYKVDKVLTLYGIKFRVSSFSYQREGYVYKGNIKFSVYSVSVSLSGQYEEKAQREIKLKPLANSQGKVKVNQIAAQCNTPYSGPTIEIKLEPDADSELTASLQSLVTSRARLLGSYVSYNEGIALKSLNSGGSWSFPDTDVITDGPNSLGKGGGYNDAVLTGGFLTPPPNSSETGAPPEVPTFQYLQPTVETVVEEDDLPTEPPPFSKSLRDLSSVFDLSGPKKVRKITTQVYGQPDIEEIWIYGFVYTAEDIGTNNGGVLGKPLKSTNPGIYWKVVEYTKTTYIYTAPPALTLQIFATDPKNADYKYPVVIKKGYSQFASIPSSGGNVTFTSTASYLTSIVSQGWKLVRYQKEVEEQNQTFDSTSPSYSTFNFFTLPTFSKTAYLLKSSRAQYGQDVGAPFSVEWVNYNDLSQSEKDHVGSSNQNSQGQVAILTPDINYAEPLFVEVETTSKSGFSFIQHPEDPLEVLKTGEESYQQVKRTVVGPNQYKEKSTEYSSQDPGFSTSLEQIRFKDVYGRPPEASFRMATAQQTPQNSTTTNTNTTSNIKKYLVSSDNSQGLPSGGSLDYPDAETIGQAIKAIKTELEIEEVQASTKQKTVTWFYPNIRDGDRVSTGMDKFGGTWIVKSASWTLNYHGSKANLGAGILVTTDGTQLTLGLLKPRSASYQMQTIPIPPSGQASTQEGSITSNFTGGAFTLGEAFQNQPNRRNY